MIAARVSADADRFSVLRVLALAAFVVLALRLGYLQIVRADALAKLAEAQRVRSSSLLPARGGVYLSERGAERPFLLASTRLSPTAYVVPREITDVERTSEGLTDIVLRYEARAAERRERLLLETGQITKEEAEAREKERAAVPPDERQTREEARRQELKNDFVRRLGNPNDPYEPLIPGGAAIDAEALAELHTARLPGVAFREIPRRGYPEGTLAAHLVGFVREEGGSARGEYGVEGGLDAVLRGEAGLEQSERDVAGRRISVGAASSLIPVEHGADVVLTVDRVLQTIAEEIAQKGREQFRADRAQIIIMDPNTGALLALAAFPTFDPNDPGAIRDVGVYQNPVIADLFEPGSVFKPLVMAAALEHGLVQPDTTTVDAGPLRIGPYTINTYDGRHHGRLTMTNILEQSNNIGMVWVAQQVGADRLYQFLRRLGVGDRTGLPLATEAAAQIPPPGEWGDTRLATIGFGQGIVTTPLHMLVANAALINGGKLVQPYLVHAVRLPDGREEVVSPKVIRQVIRPEVSTTLRAMLTSVVEKGVAVRANVAGYFVGGKTGTAQVVDPATGRYSTEDKVISFIGFAPADNPAFIALVKLDNPAGLSFASGTTAPMFSELAERALAYLRIPPSREEVDDPLRQKPQ